jgi:hypothetical protein
MEELRNRQEAYRYYRTIFIEKHLKQIVVDRADKSNKYYADMSDVEFEAYRIRAKRWMYDNLEQKVRVMESEYSEERHNERGRNTVPEE